MLAVIKKFTVVKQFERIYSDDGRNDRNFDIQEGRLRIALENLRVATNAVIRASQNLTDILASDRPNKLR